MSGRDPDELDDDQAQSDTRSWGSHRLALVLVPLTLLAAGSVVAGAYQLFPFCCLPVLILGPALLPCDRPGRTDDGDGPDGNDGPPPPDAPPSPPGGGLPLPNAGLGSRRYRGEPASPLIPPRTRRPAHPPERRPAPVRH